MMILGLLLIAPSVLAGVWTSKTSWPVSASCPLLGSTNCGGDKADPLAVYVMIDVSTSVDLADIRGPVTTFLNTFLSELYCTRYNLPAALTELWVATWHGTQSGSDFYPVHDTQFDKGAAWGNNGAKLATALTSLTTFEHTTTGVHYTHPAGALEEAADFVEASPVATTRNLVVLLTDGQMGANGLNVNESPYQKVTAAIQTEVDRLKAIPDLKLITVGIGGGINQVTEDYLTEIATADNLYLAVDEFDKLNDVIETLLKQISCDDGGGAIQEPPTKYPTSGPPTFSASPTTTPPTLLNSQSPTRSPIGDDTRSPTSPAAPNAALSRATPLILLAACAHQLYYTYY